MAGDAPMIKDWATEPPSTRAEPVRQYGYALIYIHEVALRPTRRGQPPQLEVTYAVVATQLFAEVLPPYIEQQMFARWMMRYPFNMPGGYGFDWEIRFD
jgi:hypothetical protein